ncbi:MAG: RagB/SusD family nutrient uptake outer membrane protein [Tannerella sp.]|jgi:hypothetical protein|nr:RagB/SusD family nutrient uptake outer membrane protein [Tannerella sp.]
MKNIKIYSLLLALSVWLSSCSSDFLDTLPTETVASTEVFKDMESAKLAINGIARLMVSQNLSIQTHCGEGTIKFMFGEYVGENFSRPALASGWYTVMNATFHENNSSTYNNYPWFYYYMLIGNANLFLTRIDGVEGRETDRQFLKAQALTYRAFSYMQLVQFYCYRWVDSNNGTSVTNKMEGLVLRTDANYEEKDLPLVSSGEIYKQIYADLDEAISLYEKCGLSRSDIWEPNINVAYATYARAALTRQDYAKADEMAQKARKGYVLMSNNDYTSGFSESNNEWIWGSYGGDDQPLHYYGFHSYMAYDANTSIIRSYPVCISRTLYDKIPDTDIRKGMFLNPGSQTYSSVGVITGSFADSVRQAHSTMLSSHQVAAYMSFKFSIDGKRGVGYINHFRSSEMILIEAEAKYFAGDEAGAQTLLNELTRLSKRDEEYECTATGADLLAEIKLYRSIELWGEGFDWLDKKRYKDPITRVSFANGGSFGASAAVNRAVDYGNKWTYVTPLIESENNRALD